MPSQEISNELLSTVTGGDANTMRAAAVAGMELVSGEQGPRFQPLDPAGQSTSQGGGTPRKPFEPLQLPGGGTATFGQ